MACNGKLIMNCSAPGCSRGAVRGKERELKHRDANTGVERWGYRITKEKCRACDGTGKVKCTNCNGDGIDKMLE